jgi:hypothetical protein
MGNIIKNYSIVFFIFVIILVSGCIIHTPTPPVVINSTTYKISDISTHSRSSAVMYTQPTPEVTSQYPPDPSHWIQINPVRNFLADPRSDSVKLLFNVTGTTNLPVNSLLFIELFRGNLSSGTEEQALIWGAAPVGNNGGAYNTFFYLVNVSAVAGEYSVVVHRRGVTNRTGFMVFGKDPPPWLWIRIDPIGQHHVGESFNITGTTNIPAGSDILVTGGAKIHSCPTIPPEEGGSFPGSECGNSCIAPIFYENISAVPGIGINTWNFPVNTTGWCNIESYSIDVSKKEWDNVSSASEAIQILAA